MSYDVRHRPPLTMRLKPMRMRCITWLVRMGKFSPNIWNPWPRFVYTLCNSHTALTINVNWVICQNSVRPCVKDECDVCACAKSRDLSVGGRKQLHFYPRGASDAPVRAIIVCPSVYVCVCLSVCVSHASIVSKRLNVGSRKQRHVIAKSRWWTTPFPWNLRSRWLVLNPAIRPLLWLTYGALISV